MKKITILLCGGCLLVLCACVYEVPLTEKAVVAVDPELTGTWLLITEEGTDSDPNEKMVILPFSANEHVVVLSPGDKSLYFKAYPVEIDDLHLIQVEWLGIAPDKKERYQVCRYALVDDILTVDLLNDKVIGAGIKTSKALRETVLSSRDNPYLFGESGRYRKLEN